MSEYPHNSMTDAQILSAAIFAHCNGMHVPPEIACGCPDESLALDKFLDEVNHAFDGPSDEDLDNIADSYEPAEDDGLTDVEADAMTLASAGWGTDEDYGYFGDRDDFDC